MSPSDPYQRAAQALQACSLIRDVYGSGAEGVVLCQAIALTLRKYEQGPEKGLLSSIADAIDSEVGGSVASAVSANPFSVKTGSEPGLNLQFPNHVIQMTVDGDGTLVSRSKKPMAGIGIKNIAELKNYNIERVDGRVMHILEFWNGSGGELTLSATANKDGSYRTEVCEFHGCLQTFRPDGFIMIEPDYSQGKQSPE